SHPKNGLHFSPGRWQDQSDDADGAGAFQIFRELHAARCSRDLAAEPVHDIDGAQRRPAGAVVRGSQQLARYPSGWPSASEKSGAVFPRQQQRTLGLRYTSIIVESIESIGFDDRTYIEPNGWFHSDELRVIERYTRPSMNYLIVQISVEDPKVLEKHGNPPLTVGRWAKGRSTSFTARTTKNWRSCKK